MDATARKNAIVVGVDGSHASDAALDWAAEEAARLDLPVHLIHAFSPDHPTLSFGSGLDASVLREEAGQILSQAEQRVRLRKAELVITGVVLKGYASAALVRASHGAHMVVLGAHGHGRIGQAILGSVSMQVAAHSHCPVVVVRTHEHATSRVNRVVVGFEPADDAGTALDFAYQHAAAHRAELVVVHAWWPADITSAREQEDTDWESYRAEVIAAIDRRLAPLVAAEPGVQVVHEVTQGHPAKALTARASDADLVVVGARGRGGFPGLTLGSTAHAVLRYAPTPVAIVRPRRF